MIEINPQNLKEMLNISYKLKQTPFLWGLPGIGKSRIVADFAKENNLNLIDIRLALKEPTDIQGLPNFYKDENDLVRTKWSIPDFFPTNPDWKGVIFLDEFNLAQPSVLNATYQLINERRINDYILPDGAFIVAAGNPPECNINATELPQALKNRFNHYNIHTSIDDWVIWAIDNNINNDVIVFLKTQKPELLLDKESLEKEENVYATPRTWEKVSNLMKMNLDKNILRNFMCGMIGMGATAHFLNFLEDKEKFQNPEEIYLHKKPFKTEEINIFYGTLISTINAIINLNITEKERKDYTNNLLEALISLKNEELKAFSATIITSSQKLKMLIKGELLLKLIK